MVKIDNLSANDIWFSHQEKVYLADIGKFSWTEDEQIWDWDQLTTINVVRVIDGRARIVVRRKALATSRRQEEKIELRFMLGFDFKKVHEPEADYYIARRICDESRKYYNKPQWDLLGPSKRWFIKMDKDYWIWQWAKDDEDINDSDINKIYNYLKEELEHSNKFSKNIFELDLPCQAEAECKGEIFPVIYQPAVDAMKNFIREVHCAPATEGDIVEVTIIFNNEQLRKHAVLNRIYELFRELLYGREMDIETLNILIKNDINTDHCKRAKGFYFSGIYSGNNSLTEDSIHGESKDPLPHPVRYYIGKQEEPKFNQPVIFVNTSNHAMAEHDTNPRLWKWEYVPWLLNSGVGFGNKTRCDIDNEYLSLLRKIIKVLGVS